MRAPGYVLASGEALLRLYRATGDVSLLELLRDTVHNLARHLPRSRGRRAWLPTIRTAGGRTRARRSSRWTGLFDGIGLLSYTEIPSIYVRPDTGFVFVFDHVTTRIKDRAPGQLTLSVTNPTRSEAALRVLSESTAAAAEPLSPGAVLGAQTVMVPAGATISLSVPPLRARSP